MSDPDAPADGIAAATPSPSQDGRVAPAGWLPPAVPGRARAAASGPGSSSVSSCSSWWPAVIASHVSVNDYVITPGDATPVSQYIEVPHQDSHPLTGQDPADRRLRHPAQRAQLPAVPLLRLRQRDDLGARAPRAGARRRPVPRPGLPPDGPGPVLRHRGGAEPSRATPSRPRTPAHWSTGSSRVRPPPRRCTWRR